VKINIPEVLVHLRAKVVESKQEHHLLPTPEAVAMHAARVVFDSPRLLGAGQRLGAAGARLISRGGVIRGLPGPLRGWSRSRDTPVPAKESFRAWWSARERKHEGEERR
jgi:L-lactate dehydrogenase complex protein LldF